MTSLQTTNSVTNQVTVDFAQFSRAHVELNAKGGIGETTEAGWDFVKNVEFHRYRSTGTSSNWWPILPGRKAM